MTKTIRLDGKSVSGNPKYIKFDKVLTLELEMSGKISYSVGEPEEYDYIELICQNYNESNEAANKVDLMFAYDDGERDFGSLYLGKWNDGIVKP